MPPPLDRDGDSDGQRGVAAWRALQTKVLAQGHAVIIGPEQAARLQFRDHQVDKIVESTGQIGRLHQEAVGAAVEEPCLHIVGDLNR